MRWVILLVLAPFLSAQASIDWPAGAEIEKIDGGTIHFRVVGSDKVPPALKTPLKQGEFVGNLVAKGGGPPFLLLSGKPCDDCDEEKFLYLIRADGSSGIRLVYPGRVKNRRSGKVVLKTRAFYGKCLPRKGDVFVSFQKEKVSRRRYLQSSVFVAEAKADGIKEQLIVRSRSRPRIRRTLRRVKKKQCFEIKGFTRKTHKKVKLLRRS